MLRNCSRFCNVWETARVLSLVLVTSVGTSWPRGHVRSVYTALEVNEISVYLVKSVNMLCTNATDLAMVKPLRHLKQRRWFGVYSETLALM